MDDQPQIDAIEPALADPQPLSTSDAVRMLGRLNSSPRDESGRFEPARKDDAESPSKVVDLKTGKAVAETEPPVHEDDDPEFELPSEEEGKEPVRRKLSELWTEAERAKKLEGEVEELRAKALRVPDEFFQVTTETQKARLAYIDRLETLKAALQPVEPSREMLDPSSDKYDPDRYRAMLQRADMERTRLKQIETEIAAQKQKAVDQWEASQTLLKQREAAKLREAWPEYFKDAELQRKFTATLMRDYGFQPEDIQGMIDSRHYLVVRDAMLWREQQKKSAETARVVRSKPKLVRSSARAPAQGESNRHRALTQLQKTGSMSDAAAALKGLI